MTRVLPDLYFETLFAWLCTQLPSEISLEEGNTHFFALTEGTDFKHFEAEETALISDLCMALYTVAHTAKDIFIKIRPIDIRKDLVKKNFEERLHYGQEHPSELNVLERDLKLIDMYFNLNSGGIR